MQKLEQLVGMSVADLEIYKGGFSHALEISKEHIRECVTVPGCCCCIPLLYNS